MNILMVALLFGADAAPAQNLAAAEATDGKKAKLICVREEVTGTRLGGRRVCKTQAQWDDDRHAVRDVLDRQRRGRATVGSDN